MVYDPFTGQYSYCENNYQLSSSGNGGGGVVFFPIAKSSGDTQAITGQSIFNESVNVLFPKAFFDGTVSGGKGTSGRGSGTIFEGIAGHALDTGHLCYMTGDTDVAEWLKADANVVNKSNRKLGVCMSGVSADATTYIMTRGLVAVNDAYFNPSLPSPPFDSLIGAPIYVSANAEGAFSLAAPSGSGDVVRIVGHFVSAFNVAPVGTDYNVLIDFQPDNTWIEI